MENMKTDKTNPFVQHREKFAEVLRHQDLVGPFIEEVSRSTLRNPRILNAEETGYAFTREHPDAFDAYARDGKILYCLKLQVDHFEDLARKAEETAAALYAEKKDEYICTIYLCMEEPADAAEAECIAAGQDDLYKAHTKVIFFVLEKPWS